MPRNNGRIGLKDVARHAGLSPQTVSMVLGGRNVHLLREETRQRCLVAARELGYAPNTAARAARTGRFRQFGLLVAASERAGILPTQILHGIHDALFESEDSEYAGMGLCVDFVDPESLRHGRLPRLLAERAVDALLVNYTHRVPGQLAQTIERLRLPAIWVNALTPADCVLPDERAAAGLAVAHARGHGAVEIAYFSLTPWTGDYPAGDPREGHFSLRERWLGYLDAVRRGGGAPRAMDVEALPQYCADLAVRRRAGGPPEAVVTYKETDAIHLLSVAKERGVRLPEDLLIETFAPRSFLSPLIDHEITTWNIPYRAMGRAAVRLALRKIESPDEPLLPELIPYEASPHVTPIPGSPEDLRDEARNSGRFRRRSAEDVAKRAD